MIERAITALKANEAAALKAFNDEKNKEFRDRDLYVYCFSLPDGNFTAYQSPVMIGTNVKELKIPPNIPVGQRAYDAVANAPEGEIVSFTYDFPKPGTKAPVPKETLEVRVGKQACGVSYFKSQPSSRRTLGTNLSVKVLSGGIDISATVSSGGAEIVSSGGIAGGITILKGGVELAANDGVISGAVQRAPGNDSEADAMRGTAAAVELFVFQS